MIALHVVQMFLCHFRRHKFPVELSLHPAAQHRELVPGHTPRTSQTVSLQDVLFQGAANLKRSQRGVQDVIADEHEDMWGMTTAASGSF